MEISDNPNLRKDTSDPTLFCTAYKKNRFYMFTRREPDETNKRYDVTAILFIATPLYCHAPFSGDSDRDVFNEKPSKEEVMGATQVR